MPTVDRARLTSLIERERATYSATHPTSAALNRSATHLLRGVPMTWMAKWSGGGAQPATDRRGGQRADAAGDYGDASDGGRRVGGRRADPQVRRTALVIHADRDGREPLGDQAGDRATEGLDLPLLLLGGTLAGNALSVTAMRATSAC